MASLLRLAQVYSFDCCASCLYVIGMGFGRWCGPAKREVIGDGDARVSTFCHSEARRLWLVAGRLARPIADAGGGSVERNRSHPSILRTTARYDAARRSARRQRP